MKRRYKKNTKEKKNELEKKNARKKKLFTFSIDFAIHSSIFLFSNDLVMIEPNLQPERIAVRFLLFLIL